MVQKNTSDGLEKGAVTLSGQSVGMVANSLWLRHNAVVHPSLDSLFHADSETWGLGC